MNKTTVFSKTGKGLLEIKNKSNRLSKDQFRVLNLVDGKATLDDLVDKSRVTEVDLRKILTLLSDGGFIKEFTNPAAGGDFTSVTIPPVPPSTSYVDDLDFTQILGPAKTNKPGFYQSAATEQRQREEAERKAAEAAATKAREESTRRAQEEAERRAREEEAARRIRAEAERKAKEEEARRQKLEAEMRGRIIGEKQQREEVERRVREKMEAEKRAKEDAERKVREDAERRAKIQAEAAARVEAERRRMLEEERKRREEEERKRKEEEERKRKEEEERKRRQEEEERRRREEEERKRKEEEERKRREEEERRRREEEERKRKEEEERKRREDEDRRRREEEERKRKEEEERQRREEEDRRRREEEERKRREEEEERIRREEEERQRRAEEERKRKEEEERRRREEEERLRRELEERHRREAEELRLRLEGERRDQEEGGPRLRADQEERARREAEEREAEERRRREDEERRRREEDERRELEEQERRRREEAEARKRREEEEQRSRREDEERKRKEERERNEQHDANAFPVLDFTDAPAPLPEVAANFDSDLEALKRAEAEVEREFLAKEETIRKALEEQERRFRLEDEARTAMDRAEREAREKSDREARELAEAAERARREAEQRSREESIRRQQEEKEKRARDQEERKKKAEEANKKRDRDRREAEQRAREEALARQRAEAEERDRKKSERERLSREAKKIAWGPGRIAVVAVVVLIGLVIGGIQVAPLSAYAPEMERLASDAIGEPVRLGGVHASMFPSFHLRLQNVTVGAQQDVRAPTVIAYMDFGSLFGGDKVIKTLQIEALQATQELLPRLDGWLKGGTSQGGKIKVQRIVFKDAKLDVKGATVPPFNAQVFVSSDGTITRATLESTDGHLSVELLPKGQEADVTVQARNLNLPLGPPLQLTDGTAKGVLSGNQIRLTDMDLYLYAGQLKGQAVVSWGPAWTVEGDFEIKHLDLEAGMKALNIDIASSGSLTVKGRYALQGSSVDTLFDNPRLEAAFAVEKGELSGLDFVRALQSPTREGIQGGKTKFDELTGNLSISGARYTYSNMRLASGLLAATGGGEVAPNKEINGRAYVELRSSSNVVKGTFRIFGNPKAIVVKP
jgi:hypothetical protein